jgi:hypothetical protein
MGIRSKSGWWVLLVVALIFFLGYLTPPRRFRIRTEEGKEGKASILEDPDGRPIRAETDFDGDGKTDACTYFFRGKDVLMLGLDKEGRVTGSAVTYYDEERNPKIMWVDRTGSGNFTDRVVYEDKKPRKEIWLRDAWWAIERRDSKQGVVIDNQWLPVSYTNGAWFVQQ